MFTWLRCVDGHFEAGSGLQVPSPCSHEDGFSLWTPGFCLSADDVCVLVCCVWKQALTLCDARTLRPFCRALLSSRAAAGEESGGSGFFFGCTARLAGILVSQPGIEPWVPAVKAPSPNCWAGREVPAALSSSTPVPTGYIHCYPRVRPTTRMKLKNTMPTEKKIDIKATYCMYISILLEMSRIGQLLETEIRLVVTSPPAMQETPVWFLGWEDPLERG